MRVAVIDADLIGRKRHRFPNLACMKISGYHKAMGDSVSLRLTYNGLDAFERVYSRSWYIEGEEGRNFEKAFSKENF